MENKQLYKFGEFVLNLEEQTLLKNSEAISITPKVFLLLKVLVENHGKIVEKEDLMKQVWEDSFVEDSNLTYSIRQLRKILSDDFNEPKFIETVPRRGYRFIAEVTESSNSFIEPIIDNSPKTNITKSRRNLYYIAISSLMVLLFVFFVFQISAYLDEKLPFEKIKLSSVTSNGQAFLSTISSDGKFIAYVKDEGGKQSLWIRQSGESNDVEVVKSASQEFWGLSFSPDNTHIYYTAWENNKSDAILYQTPILGGVSKKILETIDSGISFSPDGNSFVFIQNYPSGGKSFLQIYDVQTSAIKQFAVRTHPETFDTDFSSPAFSPDGKTIVAVGASNTMGEKHSLLEFEVASGNFKELLSKDWVFIEQVVWEKSGKRLLIVARKNVNQPTQIWQIDYPSGNYRKISNDLNEYRGISVTADSNKLITVKTEQVTRLWINEGENFEKAKQISNETGMNSGREGFAFLPDGNLIARFGDNGQDDIWEINTLTFAKKRLTNSEGENIQPTVSADGKTIIFSSNREGFYRLWQIDEEGKNLQKVTNIENEPELYPHISPLGNWIVYQQGWRKPTLWKVSPDNNQPLQLTKTMSLRPVISPDGKLVAYYYLDREVWGIAVISIENGEVINKFPLPKTVTSRTLRWTPDGKSVAYVDTQNGISNVWLQPLNSVATKLTNYDAEKIFHFEWSKDGNAFAVSRGTISSDAVIIEND